MAPRSYLHLSKDERDHALALHRESIVIDSSIVAVIDTPIIRGETRQGGRVSNLTASMKRS
jgi:hypothetical protein